MKLTVEELEDVLFVVDLLRGIEEKSEKIDALPCPKHTVEWSELYEYKIVFTKGVFRHISNTLMKILTQSGYPSDYVKQSEKSRKYKSDAFAAIHETAQGMFEAGLLDKEDMRRYDRACLEEPKL